jgi:hypothetical protein
LNSRNTQYTAKTLAGERVAVEIAPDGTIRLVPVTAPVPTAESSGGSYEHERKIVL